MRRSHWMRFAVPFLMAAGCADTSAQAPETTFTEENGVPVAHTILEGELPSCDTSEEVLRIGSVAGGDATELFGLRAAAKLSDGRIVVLNSGSTEVRVFSSEGEPVTQFGTSGDGPGEFRNLWSLQVLPGDELVVGDHRPWRFSFFTPAGEFQRATVPEPRIVERPEAAFALPDGDSFIIGEPCCYAMGGFSDRNLILTSYGAEGVARDSLGSFGFDRFGMVDSHLSFVGNPVFGSRGALLHLDGDHLLQTTGRDSEVQVWDTSGERLRVIRWTAGPLDVDASEIEEWRGQVRRRYEELFPDADQGIVEAQVGEHRPVAERFPSPERVMAGRDGRIWVKEYRRPSAEGLDRWFVFESDGSFICEAGVTEGLELLEVGEDYLLARLTDELDVEYLVERRIAGLQ